MKSLVQSNIFSSSISPVSLADTLRDYFKKYLTSLDASEQTKIHYRRRLKQFAIWVEDEDLSTIENQSVLDYKKFLRTKGHEASTIGAYLVAVRQFFQWAEVKRIHPDVTRGIKGVKRPRGFRRDALTIPQIHKLLDSIDRSTLIGKRDYAMINLMIRVGLRSIEVVRCRVSDIRPVSSSSIGLWVHGKGRDEADEYVVITEDCLNPIMEYISSRPSLKQDAPLFASLSDGSYGSGLSTCTVRRVVKERLQAAGLKTPRICSHSLRHSCLSIAVQNGASIFDAQRLGRHQDISTTQRYIHLNQRSQGIGENSVANALKK